MGVEIWQALALAASAGFVNHLQKYAGDSPPPWSWRGCAVKVFTGAFVGFLALLLTRKHWEAEYVLVAIAIAAYGGPLTLDAAWAVGRDALASWASRAAQKRDP